jgi:hypothetical protein
MARSGTFNPTRDPPAVRSRPGVGSQGLVADRSLIRFGSPARVAAFAKVLRLNWSILPASNALTRGWSEAEACGRPSPPRAASLSSLRRRKGDKLF